MKLISFLKKTKIIRGKKAKTKVIIQSSNVNK